MISTRTLRIIWVVLILALMAGLVALLSYQAASAKAGAVSWAFGHSPTIEKIDGYWVIDRNKPPEVQRRAYDKPTVVLTGGVWVVSTTSGNTVDMRPYQYNYVGDAYPVNPDESACWKWWIFGASCEP